MNLSKKELLVDYCQRCGKELGSFDCCQSSTNKSLRIPDNSHVFRRGIDGGLYEDFEQSIGE